VAPVVLNDRASYNLAGRQSSVDHRGARSIKTEVVIAINEAHTGISGVIPSDVNDEKKLRPSLALIRAR
jgi:hypothetical protein